MNMHQARLMTLAQDHEHHRAPIEHAVAPILGRHVSRLSGYAPAIPTPFDERGFIDHTALEMFFERQVNEGATALVVCGPTGEASTLSRAEHETIVRIASDVANGEVPVIAAAVANATKQAIELAQDAEAAGADAILAVVPYYNKPTQAGLIAHFEAIADATSLPIMLHDMPARTVCGLADGTIAQLAERARFIGLMDSTGDITRPQRLRAQLGADFRLMSGDDRTACAFIINGGNGCISLASNVAPGLCRSMYLALKRSQICQARRFADAITVLTDALAGDTDPVPLKFALSLMHMMSPRVRLPLVELGQAGQAEVTSAMAHLCECYADLMINDPDQ